MVLESLVRTGFVKKHPLYMLFFAIIVSSASLWISYLTFPESSSILAIAFITIALVPIIHTLFVKDEAANVRNPKLGINFLTRNVTAIKIYAWFFIGLIISYSFWYVAVPPEVENVMFKEQTEEIDAIGKLKASVTGKVVQQRLVCGNDFNCWFMLIFYNNGSVLLWAILFSFIFGAGAIFLIGWNASIIGIVIGRDVIGMISAYAYLGNMNFAAAYLHGLFNAIGFLPHGLPESLGYFSGAIAGAIISVAISKRKYKTHEIGIVARDALILIIVGLAFILLGAGIEATILAGY